MGSPMRAISASGGGDAKPGPEVIGLQVELAISQTYEF